MNLKTNLVEKFKFSKKKNIYQTFIFRSPWVYKDIIGSADKVHILKLRRNRKCLT